MAVTQLKHIFPNALPEQEYYFYDGRTKVHYGVIDIPSGNTTWLQRAFQEGYRVHPVSGQLLEWWQVLALDESALSAGEEVEGSDLGGQPAGEDGLRSSELPRDASVPSEGVDSSRSSRAAKRTPRNGPSANPVRTR